MKIHMKKQSNWQPVAIEFCARMDLYTPITEKSLEVSY